MINPPTTYPSPLAIEVPTDQELLDGYDLNVTRMLAGTGDMAWGLSPLVHAVFGARDIDPASREVIALRVAKLLAAPYMWQQHTIMARNAGLRPEEIDALAADGAVTVLSPDRTLLAVAAQELTAAAILTDDTLLKLRQRYGPTVTRQLIVTVGFFNLLGRFLNGTRVALETTNPMGERTAPF